MRIRHFVAAVLALSPSLASASETITYSYDAKGRLTQVAHSGTINNGVVAQYQLDAADNRSNVAVTGSPSAGPASQLTAFPLLLVPILAAPQQ